MLELYYTNYTFSTPLAKLSLHLPLMDKTGSPLSPRAPALLSPDLDTKHEQPQFTMSPPNPEDRKSHVTKLSTSSPEAIRVASEINSHRLANLLILKGPLPIRLITSQLAVEVPGFDLLSLSKQRRLIMAAMEQGDAENNVVFEKIGWGQWAVRRVDLDYIVTDADAASDTKRMNIHELKEKAKLGWSKKNGDSAPKSKRRESITNNRTNLHDVRLPSEKLSYENAMESDSDEDDEDEDEEDEEHQDARRFLMRANGNVALDAIDVDVDDNALAEDSDENEEELFRFDQDDEKPAKFKRSPPMKFANRVPTKFSPPPPLSGSRRKSSSAGAPNSVTKNTNYSARHQIFNRSRLNSIENLDNYIVSSAKNSALSVSSPPPQSGSVPSASPLGSWNGNAGYLHHPGNFNISPENIASAILNAGRRKSSFNESNIRSTLTSSLPQNGHRPYENGHSISSTSVTAGRRRTGLRHDLASDTDEEDWATIGAESLRKHSTGSLSPGKASENSSQNDERTAARALVDLMSH